MWYTWERSQVRVLCIFSSHFFQIWPISGRAQKRRLNAYHTQHLHTCSSPRCSLATLGPTNKQHLDQQATYRAQRNEHKMQAPPLSSTSTRPTEIRQCSSLALKSAQYTSLLPPGHACIYSPRQQMSSQMCLPQMTSSRRTAPGQKPRSSVCNTHGHCGSRPAPQGQGRVRCC